MQVVSAMLVMSVFLMAVAFTDGYQMGPHYSMMRHNPYPMNRYHYNPHVNTGYSNTMNGRNGDNDQYSNGMGYLPYLMATDGENGQQLATYSMLMNQGQGNNNYLSYYYMMQNGLEKAWPMMAFMNGGRRGGQGLDPYSMMMMMN